MLSARPSLQCLHCEVRRAKCAPQELLTKVPPRSFRQNSSSFQHCLLMRRQNGSRSQHVQTHAASPAGVH
eukprot:2309980-Amphidinium_carterae.1